jgi:hypothetical protein
MKCTFGRNTPLKMIIPSGIVEGLGIGWTLQPSKYIEDGNGSKSDI